jgi:lipopolysaccharide export system ATP-binding protein
VKGVSFKVDSGQVVGLLGPNGAGKTTSFYMMIGLVSADQGVVQLDSREITHLPVHKRAQLGVAYLPQEASVFRRMTAEENILAVLETRPLSEAEKRDTLQRLIEEFRLNKFIRQKAYTLSGGERRRVEVARAMALAPSFLLLDEPFAGIDPLAVADIQEVIRQLKNRNIGILITDHNARETLTICDYGYLLAEGKILVEGTPTDISHDSVAREKYFGEHFQF